MTVLYVIVVIAINVVLIILWEIFKKRRNSRKLSRLTEIHDLMNNKQYNIALSMLEEVKSYYPPVAYQMIGECYYGLDDKEKALEFFNRSLSLDINMDMAYLGIAQIEIDKGEYDKAENSLKRAIDIDNNNVVAMYYLAKIYNIAGKHLDAAILLENAIAKGLTMQDAYILLRDSYQSTGDYTAVQRITEQIELLNERGN